MYNNIMANLVGVINFLAQLLMIVVIVDIFMGYFLAPYHPFREILDGIVRPMLRPIQRFLPPIQGIDFSPVVLILIIQVANLLLSNLLLSTIR